MPALPVVLPGPCTARLGSLDDIESWPILVGPYPIPESRLSYALFFTNDVKIQEPQVVMRDPDPCIERLFSAGIVTVEYVIDGSDSQ